MASGLDVSLVSLKKKLSHVTATVLVQFCNYLFDTSLSLHGPTANISGCNTFDLTQ